MNPVIHAACPSATLDRTDAIPTVDSLMEQVDVDLDALTASAGEHQLIAEDEKDLTQRLPHWLYGALHTGHVVDAATQAVHQQDPQLEKRLIAATSHPRLDRSFPIIETTGSHTVVLRDGVRVGLPQDQGTIVGHTLALEVPSYRRKLSPGFFFIEGSRPVDTKEPTLRVYAHLSSPVQAVSAWADATDHLEKTGARYRAKVLSASVHYPRRDALVVYLQDPDTDLVNTLADSLARHTEPATSAFARTVAPGVAVAWEPDDSTLRHQGLSFGQQRAHVLADALLSFQAAPFAPFIDANIDPDDVSRNLDFPAP